MLGGPAAPNGEEPELTVSAPQLLAGTTGGIKVMRDWRATFLQVETDPGFDLATSRVYYAARKVWSLNGEAGAETSLQPDSVQCLEGKVIVAPRVDSILAFLERDVGPIKTAQRIDLCSLAAPLLVCGHVTSTSLDALADYFGVPDRASKLDTMIEVWEGLLAAYLLKVDR